MLTALSLLARLAVRYPLAMLPGAALRIGLVVVAEYVIRRGERRR